MIIPFSPPFIDDDIIKEVTDTLKSGWITTGPKVKSLENEIVKFTGAEQVLCVNSWTSAAIMILRWLGVEKGDEVIVPAYTYCATALAVLHAGAKPVMVDINDDFNVSLENVRSAITIKTKAIIPVDIAGWPCDYEGIRDLINSQGIKKLFTATSPVQKMIGRIMVISDAAHSLGAMYSGKYVGSNADVVIFSLHAVKNITTAEGGAICLNLPDNFDNRKIYSQLRLMSLNCQTKDAYTKSAAGGWRYDITGLGMKANMADLNAALGLAQIRKYPQLLAKRKWVAEYYQKHLEVFDWALLPPVKNSSRESSYHLFPLRIKGISEHQRDQMITAIAEAGIALNVHFIPMPMLSFFKNLGYDIRNFPCSYNNYANEISLPVYPQLEVKQLEYIVANIVKVYKTIVEDRG